MNEVANSPEQLADSLSGELAAILETADRCGDPELLRRALKVVVTAIPDLLVTTEPAPAILATAQTALEGSWP